MSIYTDAGIHRRRCTSRDRSLRRGVLEIARVTSRTELAWLKRTIGELEK